jgi:hypothetical protein
LRDYRGIPPVPANPYCDFISSRFESKPWAGSMTFDAVMKKHPGAILDIHQKGYWSRLKTAGIKRLELILVQGREDLHSTSPSCPVWGKLMVCPPIDFKACRDQ